MEKGNTIHFLTLLLGSQNISPFYRYDSMCILHNTYFFQVGVTYL